MMTKPIFVALLSAAFLVVLLHGKESDRDYTLEIGGLEFDSSSEDMVKDCNIDLNVVNETTKIIGGSCELIKPIPDTAFVRVEGFESTRDDNGYETQSSMSKEGLLCDFWRDDDLIVPEILGNSNFEKDCSFKLQKYNLDDWVLNMDALPNHMPGRESWRFDCGIYSDNTTAGVLITKITAHLKFPRKKDDNEDDDHNDNNNNNH